MRASPELSTLKINLDPEAGAPLHVQLHRALRGLVIDGALVQGDRLPSTRSLAATLDMSRDTVEAAYAQLESEGYLVRRTGSGSFVSSRTHMLNTVRSDAEPLRIYGLSESDVSRRGHEMVRGGGVYDQVDVRTFAAGIPETRAFPINVWERLRKQVIKDMGSRVLRHEGPMGAEWLRRAIASYLNQERGAKVSADRVMILSSSQQALWLCAHVLFDAGDEIFIEDPCYHGARKAFDAADLVSVPVAVDPEGMKTDVFLRDAASRARAVYLTPSHQYPTGATLSLDRRLHILEWARGGRWIIEDDYDSEFHYLGHPTACLQGLDSNDRTLYIGTFSKSLYPSLRIGYMVLPRSLVEPMSVARTLIDGHTTNINQLTLARFIETGHYGSYVRTMRKVYASRLELLSTTIRKHLGDMVRPHVPVGGLQMPCLLDDDLSERDLIRRAALEHIDLPSLSRLYYQPPSRGGWLLGFAAFTPNEITESVARLAGVLQRKAA